MHVFATSAAERTSAGPKAAAEAGLLGVVQLSRVVERCHNVPLKRGMDRQLVATTPRADTTGSRALSSAWRQARDEKVIAREDGYTYIAALRSPDLRHTTKREGDTSVTVVTSNFVLLKLFLYQPGTKKVYCVVQVVLNRLENSTQCVLPLTMVRNKPTPHKYRPEKIR